MNNGTHIKDGVIYSGGATSADQIAYDNTNSGLEATNTQEAVDELSSDLTELRYTKIFEKQYTSAITFKNMLIDLRNNCSQIFDSSYIFRLHIGSEMLSSNYIGSSNCQFVASNISANYAFVDGVQINTSDTDIYFIRWNMGTSGNQYANLSSNTFTGIVKLYASKAIEQ